MATKAFQPAAVRATTGTSSPKRAEISSSSDRLKRERVSVIENEVAALDEVSTLPRPVSAQAARRTAIGSLRVLPTLIPRIAQRGVAYRPSRYSLDWREAPPCAVPHLALKVWPGFTANVHGRPKLRGESISAATPGYPLRNGRALRQKPTDSIITLVLMHGHAE